MSPTWEPTRRQTEQLFADLGLCLYVYQSIELQLKFLLPHLVVPGTEDHAPGEGFKTWRVFLDSKETLGPLIRRLQERMTISQPEVIEKEWRKLVDHRNEVVHHFAGQSFSKLSSPDEYRQAVEFIRVRRLHALPLLEMLQTLSEGFLGELLSPTRGEPATGKTRPNPGAGAG
jgi:hypothetical protein